MPKGTKAAELVRVATVVAAGNALLAPEVTPRTLHRFALGEREALVLPQLTQREHEVLEALGQSNLEIAYRLVVIYSTVEAHVSHLLTKLDARDRAQLVMLAHRAGLGG